MCLLRSWITVGFRLRCFRLMVGIRFYAGLYKETEIRSRGEFTDASIWSPVLPAFYRRELSNSTLG